MEHFDYIIRSKYGHRGLGYRFGRLKKPEVTAVRRKDVLRVSKIYEEIQVGTLSEPKTKEVPGICYHLTTGRISQYFDTEVARDRVWKKLTTSKKDQEAEDEAERLKKVGPPPFGEGVI